MIYIIKQKCYNVPITLNKHEYNQNNQKLYNLQYKTMA